MIPSRTTINASFLTLCIIGSFLFGFVLQKQLSTKTAIVSTKNVNTASGFVQPTCKWIDEPWPQSFFRAGRYTSSSFGYSITVPKGIYLLSDMHTQEECIPDNPSFASYNYATFGDDKLLWSIQVKSYTNPKSLTLQAWVTETLKYDVTFKTKEFSGVASLYAERKPLDISDDDYQNIAIVQTGKFVHIITYNDKDSGLPRKKKFEALVASVKAYTGETATPEPKYILTSRKSVNTSTDLYTDGDIRFSMEIPQAWFVRTYKDDVGDVKYSGLMASIESSPKPLFWGSGKGSDNESAVSLTGIAVKIFREPYFNAKFSDYLDTHYQKGMYQTKKAKLGSNLPATLVWSDKYYQVYNQEYVVVSGDYVYTIGVRQENMKDDALINSMLKSFKLL